MSLQIGRGTNRATCKVCYKRIKGNGIQVKMSNSTGSASVHLHCLLIKTAERIHELSEKEEIRPDSFEEMVLLTKGKVEISEAIKKLEVCQTKKS